jgi:hypothetical protein
MARYAWISAAALFTVACEAGPESTASESGLEWAEPVKVASGEAYQGPWRMNDSEFLYVDDPAVALHAENTFMAWVDNAEQEVYFQVFDHDGQARMDGPVKVSGSGDVFSWLPRVAVEGETVIIAWEEILFTGGSHGGEILVARSGDGGESFSEPVNLSNTTAGAGKGRLNPQRWDNGSLDVVIRDGQVHVAWTEYEGALKVASSNDSGQRFSEPVHVAGDDDAPTRAPSLAVGPDGRVWLAWTVGDNAAADIHLAWSDAPENGFSDARRIHASNDHADSPVIAVANDGRVHLAWTSSEGGPFRNSRIVHAHDADGSGPFSDPVVISGDKTAAYPQLAVAGARVLASWESVPRGARRPIGIGHAASDDGGGTFSAPGEIPGTARPEYGVNGGNQGLLMRKLALDERGRVALGHATFQEGEASHVWLLHGQWH